jgi:iron complex outermembrane receptor protein
MTAYCDGFSFAFAVRIPSSRGWQMTMVGVGAGKMVGQQRAVKRLLMAGSLIALMAGAGSALAQEASPPVRLAQADARVTFKIPPQSLASAVTAFGLQSGYQVSVDQGTLAGLQSPGARGAMTPVEALGRLLTGTGVTWRLVDTRSVSLEKAPQSAGNAMQLGPVRVEGANQTGGDQPFGYTNGFLSTDAVTATKGTASILETPQSISVINREQLDRMAPTRIADALAYTAGIATTTFGVDNRREGADLTLRGFGSGNLYLDGVRLNGTGEYSGNLVPDQYLLERIEVLRGPASVLFGQSQPGGLINLETKRPTTTPLREIVLGSGNFGRAYGAFDFGGPIDGNGGLLFRLTGLAYRTETQVDHTKYERFAVAPALTWNISLRTKLTVLASYQKDPNGIGIQALPKAGTIFPRDTGEIPRSFYGGDPSFNELKRDISTVGYEIDHRFSDAFALKQIVRYSHTSGDYSDLYVQTGSTSGSVLNRTRFGTKEKADALMADNRATLQFSTGAVTHNVLVGLDYRETWSDYRSFFGAGTPIDYRNPQYGLSFGPLNAFQSYKADRWQIGVYGQDQVKLDRLTILVGVRNDWARSQNIDRAAGDVETRQSDTKATWRVGATYLFDNGIAPFASYSTSFEPLGGTDFNGRAFRPTTGEQFEGGIKYQPSGWDSFLQLSYFNITQRNVLTNDPAPGHEFAQVQLGEIKSKGVEANATVVLNRRLNFIATYSYNDYFVSKGIPTPDGYSDVGLTPSYAPKHIAAAWLDYRFPSGPLAGLLLGGGVRYTGKTFSTTDNSATIPSYTVADAVLSYDLGGLSSSLNGLELSANVRNLFDKKYVSRCNDFSCWWGVARTATVNLRYRW